MEWAEPCESEQAIQQTLAVYEMLLATVVGLVLLVVVMG